MRLIESNCLIGGLSGTASFYLPLLPKEELSIFLEISSSGNVNAPIMAFGVDLIVTLTDNSNITLTSGAFSATFSMTTKSGYQPLIIVRTGDNMADWKVYYAGEALTRTALVDGVVPNIFPNTVTLAAFTGLKRNFYVGEYKANQYNTYDINKATYGFTLQTPNEVGLQNIITATTGSFSGDHVPYNKRVNRLPAKRYVIPKPAITSITGYCNCNPTTVNPEVRAVNKGIIKFTLSETSGSLIARRVCSNDFEEESVYIEFANPKDLTDQFNALFAWEMEYNMGEYTMTMDGRCLECTVPEIPYLYTNMNGLTPRPPKNTPTLVCSECPNYSCYTYIGFNDICVTITRPYACINDEVLAFTPTGFVGTSSYVFNAEFIDTCRDVISLKWGNDNQITRYFHLFGRLSTPKYKGVSEVSTSTKGIVRKLYSQSFTTMMMYTDFLTQDILDILMDALNSDKLQILINGSWQGVVMEDDLEISEEPSNMPYRSKVSATLTFREYTIHNDFI